MVVQLFFFPYIDFNVKEEISLKKKLPCMKMLRRVNPILLLQPQVSHVRRAEVMMDIHLEKALFFFNC